MQGAACAAAIRNRKVRREVWLGFEGGEALGTTLVSVVTSRVRSGRGLGATRSPTCRRTIKIESTAHTPRYRKGEAGRRTKQLLQQKNVHTLFFLVVGDIISYTCDVQIAYM